MRELHLKNCRLDKRYEITETLGRGSYAEIFAAKDTLAAPHSVHSRVVIKALNVFLQDDLDPDLERTLVENFQNEAIALDRVRHPNIISRLGHGTARDLKGTVFHYLVLEFMGGGDLQRACRERSLSLKEAFKYIEQVCAGLRHAHKQGIIHRDIKPHNLLLTADRETVKIADFGVARVHQSDAPITRVGTNIFAPPEHSPVFAGTEAMMTVRELTPASDIYSLAKSVYVLVTGETPRFFANQPITELPLTSRNEEWSRELMRVLNRATLNDPALRHQSVDEFWADLEEVRRMAAEAETTTTVRPKLHSIPQPHVAMGYSPMAPREPKFDTTRDLKLKHPLIAPEKAAPEPAPMMRADLPPQPPLVVDVPRDVLAEPYVPPNVNGTAGRKRSFRGMAVAVITVAVLVGFLYGTAVYLRGLDILPELPWAASNAKMGTANTDINLRPLPSSNNEPIGLVTRNSRVRILEARNNWYHVDVIEQGRERPERLAVNRGWIYGKYVDLDQ